MSKKIKTQEEFKKEAINHIEAFVKDLAPIMEKHKVIITSQASLTKEGTITSITRFAYDPKMSLKKEVENKKNEVIEP